MTPWQRTTLGVRENDSSVLVIDHRRPLDRDEQAKIRQLARPLFDHLLGRHDVSLVQLGPPSNIKPDERVK